MKRTLIIFGIILIALEIILCAFWFKNLNQHKFGILLGLSHFANTAIIFGIMTETLPKEKRKLIINLSFLILGLIIPILYLNGIRVQNWIDKEGIFINGIVKEKKRGAKTSPYLITEFYHNGFNYESTLSIQNSWDFEKIKLSDSVIIKFIKEYPNLNRTEKLLSK